MIYPMEILTKHRLAARQRSEETSIKTIQALLTLSAGSLTLLVTFSKSYVSAQSAHLWIVPVSWGLLSFSLVSTLLTLVGHNRLHVKFWNEINQISKDAGDHVERLKQENKPRDHEEESRQIESKIANLVDNPGRFYVVMAWLAIGSLILGLMAIASFAVVNQNRLVTVNDTSLPNSQINSGSQIIIYR